MCLALSLSLALALSLFITISIYASLYIFLTLSNTGSGGLTAALSVHNICLPIISELGTTTLKNQILPSVISGNQTCCLGITEPSGGSDVANMTTTATFDSATNEYIINGEKTYITGGMNADYITLASRSPSGISIFAVDTNNTITKKGLSRTELHKTGWWCVSN